MTEAEMKAGMLMTIVHDMKRLIEAGKKTGADQGIVQLIIFGHMDGALAIASRLAVSNQNNASGKLWARNAELYRGVGRTVEALPVTDAYSGLNALVADLERDIEALLKHKPTGPANALAVNMKPVRA